MAYEKTPAELPDGFHDVGQKVSSPEKLEAIEETAETGVMYPSIHFYNASKEIADLPQVGTALIHYKKVMERHEKTLSGADEDERYVIELQIHGLKLVDSKKTSKKSEEYSERKPSDDDAIELGLQAASKELQS